MNRYQVETDKGHKTVIAETRQEAIAKAGALGLTVLRARREQPASSPEVIPPDTTNCHGCRKEIATKSAHTADGKAMFSGKIITVIDHYCDSCWTARNSKLISDGEVTK